MTRPDPIQSRCASSAVRAALFVVLVLVGALTWASSASASIEDRLLVGMGDSYTTGGGVPGGADQSSGPDPCTQSLGSYPLVAAAELGFDGRNVACGGAVLSDFTTTSRRGAPPQISHIGGADIVTFTIGGNDVGGPSGILESSRTPATMDTFAAAVAALIPRLVATYTNVQRAAPAAEIYVLGYPDIVPSTQQDLEVCLGDRAAGLTAAGIHHNLQLLNAAIADAAARAGAVSVATTPLFAGHEMCTNTPYANGPGERSPAPPGGMLHPNAAGHLAMAAALIAAIGGSDDQPTDPLPGSGPETTLPTAGPVPRAVLSAVERAAARAIAAALLDRIRAAGRGERFSLGGPS